MIYLRSARRKSPLTPPAALLLAGGVGLIVLLRSLWLPLIGGALIVSDPLRPADALLPLAGDTERIDYGVTLIMAGYAHWLALSNMPTPPGPRYIDQMRQNAIAQGVPSAKIVEMPGTVTTTYEEAIGALQLARTKGWRSLLVVTSPYHTRRARIILRNVFGGSGIEVSVVPVADGWFAPTTWWFYEKGQNAALNEYLKLLLFWLGYRK